MIWRTTLICAGVAVTALTAQEPVNPRTDPQQPPSATSGQPATVPQARRAKTVLGSKVLIQNNVSIGTVDDIVFNDDGYIEYLVVLNEGKMVAVPWQAAKFNFEQRQAVVNIAEAKYREIPTFTITTYPNFYEPAYRTRVYGYYGIAPRERIIDRRRP